MSAGPFRSRSALGIGLKSCIAGRRSDPRRCVSRVPLDGLAGVQPAGRAPASHRA
nr:MAG TPA: hypothetical protein [Caudoviricetes sp.]